ncbi:MAG: hypothetical protein JW736_04445 [Deltaproteobacteria bacterium]|nr:hypothetical protein [Deltaproteobacteria bacterium]MBN2687013.1 hypothetical protein [Deltaproteobacteria bacterium]
MNEHADQYIILSKGTWLQGEFEICDADGKMLWIGKSERFAVMWPTLTVADPSGMALLTAERKRMFPFARFVLMEDNNPVCVIRQPNVFRQQFVMEFTNGVICTFDMPKLRGTFSGESITGLKVEVAVDRYNWNITVHGEMSRLHLLSALTVLYREWMKSD